VKLAEMLDRELPAQRVLFYEVPGQPPLRSLPGSNDVLALVGPAGGWEPQEVEDLVAGGFRPVALGPRVLRAETAAIAALTALQVLWGDLS